MDILTHAVIGAATGAAFGHPYVGAAVAVLPDIAIPLNGSFLQRLKHPPAMYDAAHSLLGALAVLALAMPFGPSVAAAAVLAWVSHIVLDWGTHGRTWGVRLFWPHPWRHVAQEWAFFNRAWYFGLLVGVVWITAILCVKLTYLSVIGSLS